MFKKVDNLQKKESDKIESKESSDVWIRHFHLRDFFVREDRAGWSLTESGIMIRPASKKLLKKAYKIHKRKQKDSGAARQLNFARFLQDIAKAFSLTLCFVLIICSAIVYAYWDSFSQKAYLGVRILGEELGGKTQTEIEDLLNQKIDKLSLVFLVDEEKIVAKPQEAGVIFRAQETARLAIEVSKKGQWHEQTLFVVNSLLQRVIPEASTLSFSNFNNNLDFIYEIDEQKLANFTQSLSLRFDQESQNAGLVMRGDQVQVIPAVYGRKIITNSVKSQIAQAVKKGKSENIKIDIEQVEPGILEKDTQESVNLARAILERSVVFIYQNQTFKPDRATIGSWIIFESRRQGEKEILVPKVDPKKVYPYIYNLAIKINVPAVNKKITVKNGAETVVDQEGKEGLAVDVDKASYSTATILNQGDSVRLELPTYVVKPKTVVNNIVVADWSKYIEVNIATQTMCAYLAGGEKVNCWAVTTGARNWPTPIGTFLIQRKSGAGGAPGAYGGGVCMPNPPSPYPLCGINYVSTFTSQGHAIHEAWWRSSFGGPDYIYNGSHGCVNAPYDVAKWIYYWAPIGTPVIIHY